LLLLGIDSSSERAVICLGRKGEVIAEQTLPTYSSSGQIIPVVDKLLRKIGLRIQDLEAVAVSLGPGSFTGLRIGLSVAKSLSFALNIPLIGIPTLESWVYPVSKKGILCPLSKAYGNRYYARFYIKRKNVRPLSEYLFLPLSDIIQKANEFSPEKVTFILRNEEIAEKIGKTKTLSFVLLKKLSLLKALLKSAEEKIQKGETKEMTSLLPLYISPPKVGNEADLNIRPMRKEDIPEVSQIEKLSFPTPWSPSAFFAEIDKKGFAFYWVIEYQHKLVGYGGYWKVGSEAHLVNLAIHPALRRRGFGEKLLRHLLRDIQNRGLAIITLEVRQSNLAACRLYEKLKFKKIAIRPHYYTDTGEDAIVYWRRI